MTESVIARLNAALEGRYRIERELGEGGMATVYLADDLKHNRKVALKVLKPELAAVVGGERFLAEIETTANLQHPHILPLFDSGDANGFLYFVMPYIEGETLRDRIDREKQLPVGDAVGIATAVASALAVAHEQGVIHRDIKPGNILLSRGEPLVADFGIAIAVTRSSGARLTETGLSVGTPYYMSPEQATGDREISASSDVYALGCVLYEMLVGDPPYVGSTAQAVLGKILTEKPRRPTAVRAMVPANVDAAVLRALEKLPADRFTSAEGLVRALGDPNFRHGREEEAQAAATQAGGARRWKVAAAALGGIAAVLLFTTLWALGRDSGVAPTPVVLELDVGELDVGGDIVVSDDGSTFAMSARVPGGQEQLWVRRLDEADFRPLPGTEGARSPDFSPDGEWIVFRSASRSALLKIPVSGGGVVPVLDADTVFPFLPIWGDGGTIVFSSPGAEVFRVSDTGAGGPIKVADGRAFDVLPGGVGALMTVGGSVGLIDFATDSVRILTPGIRPRYAATGHILYEVQGSGLFALPFDAERLEVTGSAVPVRDNVSGGFLQAGYSLSKSGTFVFREGGSEQRRSPDRRFLFLDRGGNPDTVRLTPRYIDNPRISPDGRYVVFGTYVGGDTRDQQLQVYDFQTGSSPDLTSVGDNFDPAWSPDGAWILFGSSREGSQSADLYRVPADGSGPAEPVLEMSAAQYPGDWSVGGLWVFNSRTGGNSDLWVASAEGPEREAGPYLEADYAESWPRVSPDGSMVAYVSIETGTSEVYVRGFPEPLGKWRISVGGGIRPVWAPDGEELYFWRDSDGLDSLFAVPLKREPEFAPGEPEFLFAGDFERDNWDVHPDGRFLVVQSTSAAGPGPVEGSERSETRYLVVLNFFEELKARLGEGN